MYFLTFFGRTLSVIDPLDDNFIGELKDKINNYSLENVLEYLKQHNGRFNYIQTIPDDVELDEVVLTPALDREIRKIVAFTPFEADFSRIFEEMCHEENRECN
jgi:hypothetical protein